MNRIKKERELFDPKNMPLVGSLGILALGDVGFEAWRKLKIESNLMQIDEKR